MDKTIQRISAGLIALIIIAAFFFYFLHKPLITKKYTVGLVYVPTKIYHQIFNDSLKELLKKDGRFEIVEFTAGSTDDQMLLNASCGAALESSVDIVVATAIACSRFLVQLAEKRINTKPILFMGVSDPVKLNLVHSLEYPGGMATGLYTGATADVVNPAALLLLCKPHLKKILLPYVVGADDNQAYAEMVQKWCSERNVGVTILPIDTVANALERVLGCLDGHDAIMYLEADPIGGQGGALGKIASQHGITMFASSLNGVADAALAYSANPSHYARDMVQLIERILINKQSPMAIAPLLMDAHRDFFINTKLCAQQGASMLNVPFLIDTINHVPEFAAVRNHIVVS